MKTKETINRLVDDLTPVDPLPSQGVRFAVWLGAAAAIATVLLSFTGFRRTWPDMLAQGRLWTDFLPMMVLAVVAAWSVLELSVPGRGKRIHRSLPLALLLLWGSATVLRVVWHGMHAGWTAIIPDRHLICALIVTGTAGAASVPLFLLVKRAAPLDRPWNGALIALASAGIAMVCLEFICLHAKPAHLLAWHVLPVGILTWVAARAAGRLFTSSPS